MRILCYGTHEAAKRWRRIFDDSGLAPIMTDCEPPNPLVLSEFLGQSWDALFVERGFEPQVLDLLGEATRWTTETPPVFVLGGDTSAPAVEPLVRRGAAAVLGEHELGCLPQILQQQAQMAYLELLLANPPTSRSNGSLHNEASQMQRRSQELGNQLMSISLYAELLLERAADQDMTADLERILSASSRAIELARELRPKPDPAIVAT